MTRDPLLKLVKSSKYIEGMKAAQEYKKGFEDGLNLRMSDAPIKRKARKGFRVQVGKVVVRKLFKAEKEAEDWATWNYKGKGGWKVIAVGDNSDHLNKKEEENV